jgi:hypothetical protein
MRIAGPEPLTKQEREWQNAELAAHKELRRLRTVKKATCDALRAMTERLLKVLTEVYDFLRDQGFDELADVVETAIEDRL